MFSLQLRVYFAVASFTSIRFCLEEKVFDTNWLTKCSATDIAGPATKKKKGVWGENNAGF